MDLESIRKAARERMKGACRVCPVCDGRVCAGEVPGMGGTGTGAAFRANLQALADHRFNLRTMHGVTSPDTTLELWGEKLSMPILAAPMTGASYNMNAALSEEDMAEELLAGAILAGTLGMTGDGADPSMYASGLRAIGEHGGRGIPFIKPRQRDEVARRIGMAEAAEARAVGMDMDGAGLVTMALKGQPVGPKSPAEIAEIIGSTPLPFILKGVMTPDEALLAVEAGASAIVVSNHGGRVLDHTPGAAEVLPAIAAAVKGRISILADGGVRTGGDVLKLLALGADAVLVGRPLAVGAVGGGREAVGLMLRIMRNELVQAMLLTGTADVKRVDKSILYTG
jgi:isopentenyl diphosphate isomerase/L-lactate dehydrogenase-like FMN-dependent dehydrogenase